MAAQVSSTHSESVVGTVVMTSRTKQPTLLSPISNKGPTCGNICVVCNDIAPPNSVFRRHYGVICCEACKCFFRRTVQMGRDYKCRYGSSCPVGRTAINMKQVCQACRFNRCTQSGMKIDSVKKFPRKSKDQGDTGKSGDLGKRDRGVKSEKSSKKGIASSSLQQNGKHNSLSPPTVARTTNNSDNSSKEPKNENDADFDYENDFDQFKFIASPDMSIYSGVLDATMPKLFSGDSLENIHEKSSIPTPGSTSEESSDKKSPQILVSNSPLSSEKSTNKELPNKVVKQPSPLVTVQVPPPSLVAPPSSNTLNNIVSHDKIEVPIIVTNNNNGCGIPESQTQTGTGTGTKVDGSNIRKRALPKVNWSEILLKKQRLEDALNHITARQAQVQANLQRLAVSVASNNQPCLESVVLPPAMLPSAMNYSQLNNTTNANNMVMMQDHTPYATPHETPHGTPMNSPLPSPHRPHPLPPALHYQPLSQPPTPHLSVQNISQPSTPLNGSRPTSPTGYRTATTPTSNSHFFFQNPSQIPLVYHNPQIPFPSMIPPTVRLPSSVNIHTQCVGSQKPFGRMSFSGGSVSSSISMPSSSVTSPVGENEQPLPSPSFTHDSDGKLTVEVPEGTRTETELEIINMNSCDPIVPTSSCPSPIMKPSRSLATDAPEAEVEEVLDSLRLRIRHLFKWAKSEVEDFDDLSPLDQKALLRRTVPELVMLGFARASIAYDGMLLLGSTGKVMRTTNKNSGVATVAMVTLTKLVVPLKVLNMDDRELSLMKEIVLFNPESNCLCNRETVRQYRKRKHIELREYSERNEPGRFGELLCLLTPLYEVSMEVTEQLRLEQFVHEGEARIDALLLMSMINQGDGAPEEPIEDVGET